MTRRLRKSDLKAEPRTRDKNILNFLADPGHDFKVGERVEIEFSNGDIRGGNVVGLGAGLEDKSISGRRVQIFLDDETSLSQPPKGQH